MDKNIAHPAKRIDGVVFIPVTDLLEFYDICLSYNSDNKIVSIDKKDIDTTKIKYNSTNMYEDISTSSNVLQRLSKDEDVVLYEEALQHNRWIKVKTMSGNVGYIFKNCVNKLDNASVDGNDGNIDNNINAKKYVMFWQYGSSLDGLGDKIDGVNVASPTVYEISNALGDVSGKITSGYVNKAHSYGYSVWPIITNGIDNANYSSQDTSTIMNSEIARENLIKNILNILERDNLDGINIDFEAMKSEDKELYTQFIRELAPLVREKGKVLSVDMYFVNYIDRKKVGQAADYAVLMGYDENGGWSEKSGSVSSLSWVDGLINSLMNDSNIPESKIILGVPFYTRLWTEKAGEAKPSSTIYTMNQAMNYINKNNIDFSYNEESGKNYFEYTKGSVTYKMWIEDAVSIKNRVDIVNKYNLAGISAWRKGFEMSDIWNVITSNLK